MEGTPCFKMFQRPQKYKNCFKIKYTLTKIKANALSLVSLSYTFMNHVELPYFREHKGNESPHVVKNVLFKLIIPFVITGKRMKEDHVDDQNMYI